MIGKLPKRFANGKATRTDCSSGPTHRTVSAPVSTAFPVNAAKYTSVRPAGTFTPRFKNTEHTAAEETTKNQASSNMHTHQTTASNGTTQNSSPPSSIGIQEESGKRLKSSDTTPSHKTSEYQDQRYLAPTAGTQDRHHHHSGSRVLYTRNPGPPHPQVLGSSLPEATPSPVSRLN